MNQTSVIFTEVLLFWFVFIRFVRQLQCYLRRGNIMKVIAINSSGRRRGNTYALLSQIQTLLKKEGIEMDIINLFDYQLKDCVGCEYCLDKGTCHH